MTRNPQNEGRAIPTAFIIRSTERLGYLTREGGYTSDSAEARRFPNEEAARKEILRRAPVTLMREEAVQS